MCEFFEVSGNGPAFLGMPDIDILNIIHINCNTVDTQETDRANNCNTNTAIHQGFWHKQHYTNMMQEPDRAENTDGISKSDSTDKAVVIDKEPNTINYFLPSLDQDNDKRVNAEITQ